MKKPNVILFFSDQHKASALGKENHPDIKTPNLDALANEGIMFKRAYCQDGVCVPSRSSMFSGLYPRTLGCMDNGDISWVMDKVISLQKAFQLNGYRTGAFGKRHMSHACDLGWDIAYDYCSGTSEKDYMDWIITQGYEKEFARDWAAEWGNTHPDGPKLAELYKPAPLSAQVTQLPKDKTMEAFSRDQSIEFIKKCVADNQPFFCWTSFYRPHQPYTPLQEYYDRFDRSHWGKGRNFNDGIAKPPAFDEDISNLPPMFQSRRKIETLPWNLKTAHEQEQIFRDAIAAYYACIEEIDDCIGTVVDALNDLGIKDNTIIIYTADHGEFAGAHGIMEKIAPGHNLYEDSLRVPLIFNWNGKILSGVSSEELIELVDIYPTLMDICDCKLPDLNFPLAGRSIKEHLFYGKSVGREYTVSENWSQASVITKEYKLGIWQDQLKAGAKDFRNSTEYMFDLTNDPTEENNIHSSEGYTSVKKELFEYYKEWSKKVSSIGRDAVISAQ